MYNRNFRMKILPLLLMSLTAYTTTSFANEPNTSLQKQRLNVRDSEQNQIIVENPSDSNLYLNKDTVYKFKITNNRRDDTFKFTVADDHQFIVDITPKEAFVAKGDSVEVSVTVNPGSNAEVGTKNNLILNTIYARGLYVFYSYVTGTVSETPRNVNAVANNIIQGTLISTGLATSEEGDVYVWGYRGSGQQGNGNKVVSSKEPPTKVDSLSNVKQILAGAYHIIALDKVGDVWGWGMYSYGASGCDKLDHSAVPCKIKSDITQASAGEYFTIALDKQGQVWTWGQNLYGQLGIGVKGSKYNTNEPQLVNLNGETARLIGAAYEGAFAVTKEGHVWAWGDNEASGLGFQGSIYGVQSIQPTPTHVTNLDQYADKIVYIAGGNGWGEALLNDGQVIGWGLRASLGQGTTKTNISSPEPVVIMSGVKQLFARYVGSVALTDTNEVYTWGQTGGSAFKMIYGEIPTKRETAGEVIEVGGGKEHLFYKTSDNKIYGVGYNDIYKLDSETSTGKPIDWPGIEITVIK